MTEDNHLWCPVCNVGWDKVHALTQDEADEHVFKHVADGQWPNVGQQMFNEAVARRLNVLTASLLSVVGLKS